MLSAVQAGDAEKAERKALRRPDKGVAQNALEKKGHQEQPLLHRVRHGMAPSPFSSEQTMVAANVVLETLFVI